MLIALMILAGTILLNLSDIGRQKTWDIEIPMANAHVSWQQTFYSGEWRD